MKNKKLTKKQRITTSLIALTFVLGTAVWSSPQAFAHGDWESKAHFYQTRDAIHEALMNSDYDAFTSLASDTPFEGSITPETFAKLVEAHALRQAGDKESARTIMQELGINRIGHRGMFMRGGNARVELSDEEKADHAERREEKRAHREAVQNAIEAEDYNAWLALVEGKPVADVITEDTFDDYVDAFELRESGDREAFVEAMEALGLERGTHKSKRGFGF